MRDKRIGDIKLITANFCGSSPFNPSSRVYDLALGGGALYDIGVYVIELATGILGENPNQVAGAVQYADTGADTYVSLSLGFPGGAVASLNCGVTACAPHHAAVYGTDGSIVFEDEFWRTKEARLYNSAGLLADTFREDFDDGFRYQIRHAVDLIKRGAIESDLIPWRDTIACADIFDKILRRASL